MKKLLGLALVMALFVPANAQILDNVETYGEIEILGVNHTNYSYGLSNSDYRNTQVRVIYGLGFDLLDDVRANITFLNEDKYWGEAVPADGNNTVQKTDSINGYLDSIQVAEANIAMEDVFWSWSAKLGRQFYGDEHSFVIYYGPTHGAEMGNNARPTTFLDAAVFNYEGMNTMANILYGKTTESSFVNDTGGDISFLGIEGQYMPTEEWTFKAHVYDRRTNSQTGPYADTSTNAKHIGIYGIMAAYEGNNWMIDAEYNKNYGGKAIFTNDFKADMFDFNAAYTWEASSSVWTPRLEYLDIDGGTVTSHEAKKFITFNSQGIRRGMIFGNSILAPTAQFEMWNFGLDAKFDKAEDFRFGLDYFTFADNNVATNEDIGTEWDLMAYYDYSENITFNAGAARMSWKSSNASVSATDNQDANKLQAGVNIRW
ncbi:MAG: hypothetical protein HOD04_05500 [Elusimicrobiaceae bacterium]|jgi:hypothetical protein|nr:hypothetical protein [Elusimicrobiaceae bacterium]